MAVRAWAGKATLRQRLQEDELHSDKSSLDKPHLSICDEAAARVLYEPPSMPCPYAFPHGADFGIF